MTGEAADLAGMFRDTAIERVDAIVETLLGVEAGRPLPEPVDSLLRELHSIKGSATMFGFPETSSIAHAMEDLLHDLRGRHLPPELADPLLQASDVLRRLILGESESAGPALEALAAAAQRLAAASPAERPAEAPRPSERRSMRIAADKVDRLLESVGEAVVHHRRLEHLLGGEAAERREPEGLLEELGRNDVLLNELQDSALELRTLPLSSIAGAFPRPVRDLAVAQGKEVEMVITGADTQLDRVILDGISDTITHLLRNAVAHGVEPPEERERAGKPRSGTVRLTAEQRGGRVAIEVSDDGRGVSPELLRMAQARGSLAEVLAEAGVSTAPEVTGIAGRGVGLAAVTSHVKSLGGSMEVSTRTGESTTVTLLLPLTLALLRVLLVRRGDHVLGLPLAGVLELVAVTGAMSLGSHSALEVRGRSLPFGDLAAVLAASAPELGERPTAVVVASAGAQVAAACDRVLGEQEVAVKTLGPLLAGVPGYLGAAILGDGRLALIADPGFITERLVRGAVISAPPSRPPPAQPKVLVVDDEFTVRELQRTILAAAGYDVETARDGREALGRLSADDAIELVVTDVHMPGMDGLELLRTIREQPDRASLPVVIITALSGEDDRRRGAEAGADAYIVKDEFNQQALIDTVERLIGR